MTATNTNLLAVTGSVTKLPSTQILEEDHLLLIFEVPNPLFTWVHPSADITAKVIQRLNAPAKQDEPDLGRSRTHR